MTTSSGDSAVFGPGQLEAVAEENDLDGDELEMLASDHQESVEALPGVENLVYEWRKQYQSPLIERTETAYYLVVPEWVWDEFGEALGASEQSLDALVELHRRTVVERTDANATPPGDQTYVALDRTIDGASEK